MSGADDVGAAPDASAPRPSPFRPSPPRPFAPRPATRALPARALRVAIEVALSLLAAGLVCWTLIFLSHPLPSHDPDLAEVLRSWHPEYAGGVFALRLLLGWASGRRFLIGDALGFAVGLAAFEHTFRMVLSRFV